MPSKRRLNTPENPPPKYRFLLDRNLGARDLKEQLSREGLDITAHDDVFEKLERDPWIFYWAGKNEYVLVTADLKFKGLFTHQLAVALGKTAVLSFTGRTFNSDLRGKAFLRALPKIQRLLRKQPRPFIATIQMSGEVRLDTPNPTPSRRKVDPRDWESYERVCAAEQVEPHKGIPASSDAQRGGDRSSKE